jgi:hypothetical protein
MKILQKLLSRISDFQQKEEPFLQQIGLKFKEKTSKLLIWGTSFSGAAT